MTAEEQHHIDTHDLISLERTEKFDLLVQLILNQREALIVCGAEGIGKTTLLNTFKKNQEPLRAVCLIQETNLLSFSDLKKQLTAAIKAHGAIPDVESLEAMLLFHAEHQQKVVLIVDNAGQLPQGFIDKLIKYTIKYPALRIVFALTQQELMIKSKTDARIDQGYFVELSALEKQEMGDFLSILAQSANALIEKTAINERLINKLYRQTKGNPGKTIALLQKQANFGFKWQRELILSGSLIMGGVLVYFYQPSLKSHDNAPQVVPQPVQPQTTVVNKLPIESVESPIATEDSTINTLEQKIITNQNPQPSKPPPQEIEPVKTQANNQPAKLVKSVVKIKKQRLYFDDRQWILQQSPKKYTLQLMIASKKKALLAVLRRYKKLKKSLKYVQVTRKNKRLYILFYGSFSTANTAQKRVKTLPRLFRQAWAKQFRAIQLEIKKSQ